MDHLPRSGFFQGIPDDERHRIDASLVSRRVPAGEVLLRRGDRGHALYVVESGAVRVELDAATQVHLGPGEIFGELSLLSDTPVSATVVAERDSHLGTLDRSAFLAAYDDCPAFRSALTGLLVARLRRREASAPDAQPERIVIGVPPDLAGRLAPALLHGIAHYAPRAHVLNPTASADGVARVREQFDRPASAGPQDRHHVALVPTDVLPTLAERLGPEDAVVELSSCVQPVSGATRAIGSFGSTAHLAVHVAAQAGEASSVDPAARWRLVLDPDEALRVALDGRWDRTQAPGLDRVARWALRRWVGVALGAGAALGFSHFGVLAELEAAGIPIDTLAGTSMGGVAAVTFGSAGSGPAAIELGGRTMGSTRGVRKPNLLPRRSLLSDAPLRAHAEAIAGGRSFADLGLPIAVVASDLVHGHKVVIDRGCLNEAMRATSAIPGAFPPVPRGNQLLVDGGLTSRVPADLLARHRCGLRIAVNVVARPEPDLASPLAGRIDRLFGFRTVLGSAWDLLGWWQGADEAARADVTIAPSMAGLRGFDFDAFDQFVARGREATRAALPAVTRLAQTLAIL